jgi:hypothetical protein
VKREAESMRGTDEDMNDDASATRGMGGGVVAMRGIAVRAARGTGVDTGAARGMVTVSEVPATEEG